MLKKVEVLCSGKNVYDQYDLSFLHNVILNSGLRGLNIHGAYLDALRYEDIKTNIFVNLDFPYSQHSSGARLELAKFYVQKYNFLTGFNLTPSIIHIMNEDYNAIYEEINNLTDTFTNLEFRFFVDAGIDLRTEEWEEIFKILGNTNLSILVFGSGVARIPLESAMETFNPFIQDIAHKKGIFGTSIRSLENIKALSLKGFDSIIMPPQNILNILGT